MVQVHTCVSVHCDQCGDSLGDPGFEAHHPTEDTALDAAAADGWRVGRGGRWWLVLGVCARADLPGQGPRVQPVAPPDHPGRAPGGQRVPALPAVLSARVPPGHLVLLTADAEEVA
jgi:hypothetical protein